MNLTPDATKEAKVLIVDDEPKNLQLVGEILRREGMHFIFAISGEEALEAAREQQPSLILLDMMMPGMDGLTVCTMLKSDKSTDSIPVIFLTAATEVGDLISAFAAGAVDYIRKPFIREELLARVQTHISLSQTQHQLEALYQKKTELLTTLAHDIKNPTGAIEGLATIMMEDIKTGSFDPREIYPMLELTNQSARGMTEFVNDILDEEMRTEGQIKKMTEAHVNVAEIVTHLVKLNTVQSSENAIRLTYQPTFEPMAHLNRRILTGMFDNIINNAVKYSRSNSEIIIFLLPAQSNSNGFRFEVHDSAPVITTEKRESLFKKFEKGTQSPTGKSSSHGIGLAIVKRLVDLYNGHIDVQARENQEGNIFSLEIPLQA